MPTDPMSGSGRVPVGSTSVQRVTDTMRERIVGACGLVEVGDPYETFRRPADGALVGNVRVWSGPFVSALVDARLVVPDLGLDSSMLHAFAPASSALPHLGSDLIGSGATVTFNADLTPRVDLAIEPSYLDAVYPPLSGARATALAIDGGQPVDLPLRLRAFCSPWVCAVTVPATALDELVPAYSAYVDRFLALVRDGVPETGREPELEERDRAHRRAMFDPASDEVWDLLASIVGESSVARVLALVRGSELPLPA